METKTLNIIKKAFKNKVDKAGSPYINHLIQVAENTKFFIKNKDVYIIALLHDLLEDSKDWTEDKLRKIYSNNIVDTLLLLTHKKDISYDSYIKNLSKNKYAVIVKLSDLKHNLDISRFKNFKDVNIERLKKYHKAYNILLIIFNSN